MKNAELIPPAGAGIPSLRISGTRGQARLR